MKLAVFDLENTLVFNEFLPELTEFVGRGDEVSAITQEGIPGKINWSEGFVLRSRMI